MKTYHDYKDKVTFPVTASAKLDGIFAVVRGRKLFSKNGNPFEAMNAWASWDFLDGTEGEIYSHHLTFEQIVSGAKRDEPNEFTARLHFYPHAKINRKLCRTAAELDDFLGRALAAGYEGVVIQTSFGPLKYKPVFDEEFEITGVVEGKGKLKGMVGKVVCGNFSAPLKATHVRLAELWQDRDALIGKKVTIQFQNKTSNGKPRFPQGIAIRDYE